jgi:hypothetical protein
VVQSDAQPDVRRANARRALVLGVAALLAGWIAARGISEYMQRTTSFRLFESYTANLGRLRGALRELPAIANDPRPVGLFVGSSTVMFNLSSEVLDEQLKTHGVNLSTYNLGMMSITPALEVPFVHRIGDAMAAKGRRAAVSIIELSPQSMTERFDGKRSITLKRACLADRSMMLEYFKRSPTQAFELFGIKALGGLGSQDVTNLFRQRFFNAAPSWWPGPASPVAPDQALSEELYQALLRTQGSVPDWDLARRGQFRRLFEGTRELYTKLNAQTSSDAALTHMRQIFTRIADFEELHFSDEAVDKFIEATLALKQISDRTVIMLMPRNQKYNQPTPAGRARLEAVTKKIREATGLEVIDMFDSTDYTVADYYDVIHLNELTGQQKFSREFADRLASALAGSSPGVPAQANP